MYSNNILKFERTKDVSGWSFNQIRDYMKEHHWKGFKTDWDEWLKNDKIILERTT